MGYAFKWGIGSQTQLFGSFNPIHPAEKMHLGIMRKPSKRLNLFAELKADKDNRTEFQTGYRCTFPEGVMTGILTSGMKGIAVYRRAVNEMFNISFTGSQDFSKPQQPVSFGVS